MAQSYFEYFWIITDKGKRLYPASIRKQETGKESYRILAKGSNRQRDGKEIVDPIEAIQLFLGGESMRFGCEGGGPDNRFTHGSAHVRSIGFTAAFKKSNPSLSL